MHDPDNGIMLGVGFNRNVDAGGAITLVQKWRLTIGSEKKDVQISKDFGGPS